MHACVCASMHAGVVGSVPSVCRLCLYGASACMCVYVILCMTACVCVHTCMFACVLVYVDMCIDGCR